MDKKREEEGGEAETCEDDEIPADVELPEPLVNLGDDHVLALEAVAPIRVMRRVRLDLTRRLQRDQQMADEEEKRRNEANGRTRTLRRNLHLCSLLRRKETLLLTAHSFIWSKVFSVTPNDSQTLRVAPMAVLVTNSARTYLSMYSC